MRSYARQNQKAKKPLISFTPEAPKVQAQAQTPQRELPELNLDMSAFQFDPENPYANLFGSLGSTTPNPPSIQPKSNVGAIGNKWDTDVPKITELGAVNKGALQRYSVIGTPDYSLNSGRAGTSKLRIDTTGGAGPSGDNAPNSKVLFSKGKMKTQLKFKHLLEPYAMHLVNGRLGGSGKDKRNLAWGTHNFNNRHTQWEVLVQDQANGSRSGGFMDIKVIASYKSDDPRDGANFHLLDKLGCYYRISDTQKGLNASPWEWETIREQTKIGEADPEWKPRENTSRKPIRNPKTKNRPHPYSNPSSRRRRSTRGVH